MKKLILILALPFIAASSFAAEKEGPFSPFDALTQAEVATTVDILQKAGDADDQTYYPTITMQEGPKADMRAWVKGKPIQRNAFVVLRRSGKTYEAVVDISAAKIVSYEEKPGAQPAIMEDEWNSARDLLMADPRFKAAIARRNLKKPNEVFCTPNSAGAFPGDGYDGKRILKIPCFTSEDKIHPAIARPIEGLMGIVDTDAKKVLDVIDTAPVDLAPVPADYAKLPKQDAPMKPIAIVAPEGTNIQLSGNLNIKWANWTLHARADKRAGLIISNVKFNDQGKQRDVAWQMNVSEVFVPYMDPDDTWSYRTFLDAGEFGLGYLVSSLSAGVDCPVDAYYRDLVFPNDTGGTYVKPSALCIFERATGDPAWRHYTSDDQRVVGVPQTELVIRHIPTLGNYDYVVDYVFTPQGAITMRVGATGFVAVKTSAAADSQSPTADADSKYGTLVAPYTIAPNHDHYFSFRLDMDVDGEKNALVRDQFVMAPATGSKTRKSLWTVKTDQYAAEGPIEPDRSAIAGERWRIINPNETTKGLKNYPGYMLMGHTATSILSDIDPAQRRAGFSSFGLWVTKERADQQWAAGLYPNLSGPDQGLPDYVKKAEPISNEDLVLWYTMGFHHAPRPEEFPIMPTTWHELTLAPAFFFDRDPSMTFNPGQLEPPPEKKQ
jgi:primary-amine oxidase